LLIFVIGLAVAILPQLSKGIKEAPSIDPATLIASRTSDLTTDPTRMLAAHFDAIGGRDALREAQSIEIEGRMDDGSEVLQARVIGKRPELGMLMTTLDGGEVERRFVNGDIGWEVRERDGRRETVPLDALERHVLAGVSRLLSPLEQLALRGEGTILEVRRAKYTERAVYGLKVDLPDRGTIECFLDRDTLFLVGAREEAVLDGKLRVIEQKMSDFRMVSGVVRSHQILFRVDGALYWQISARKIEINSGVVPSLFDVPPEIK
jgi:hypothetical protein